MALINIFNIYKSFPGLEDTDFLVGKDSFEDVQINGSKSNDSFYYFKNTKKGLITRFILKRSERVEKVCVVTLIKKANGKFTPRFDFQIWDSTNKAVVSFSKTNIDQNLIKAKVSLDSCYEEFNLLLDFIRNVQEIDFPSSSYAVVDQKKKDVIDVIGDYDKLSILAALQRKFGSEISEKDAALLLNRKDKLDYFKKLLDDPDFFIQEKNKLGEHKRDEDVWQTFFEANQWIFGYGLQLVYCEGLDEKKLEQTVVGNDIIDGSGKRIDALLKTKGAISKLLFCEIKTHLKGNLIKTNPYRPSVFVPSEDLQGAVAQIQKTIHKVILKLHENCIRPTHGNGEPTGEELFIVKPRGIIVIGKLDDFNTDHGINHEMLSSFEIYRQQINGIDIITYDELFERVKFIVGE